MRGVLAVHLVQLRAEWQSSRSGLAPANLQDPSPLDHGIAAPLDSKGLNPRNLLYLAFT